jgi:hypothetical protein
MLEWEMNEANEATELIIMNFFIFRASFAVVFTKVEAFPGESLTVDFKLSERLHDAIHV